MQIGGREVEQIIVADDTGEVLAVISDGEIVEKKGVHATIDYSTAVVDIKEYFELQHEQYKERVS